MSIVACPSCAVRLTLGDHLTGKSVKCPKCAKVFVASAEPPEPVVLSLAPEPPNDEPRRRPRDDDDDERRSRQRRDFADDEYDEPRRSRRRDDDAPRGRRRRDDDEPRRKRPAELDDDIPDVAGRWRTCRNGVRLAMYGAAVIFMVSLVQGATALVLVTLADPRAPRAAMRPSFSGLGWLALGLGVTSLAAAIVHFVGQVMCCWTPAPYRERAVRFLAYFGLSVGMVVVMFGAIFIMAANGMPEPDVRLYAAAMLLVIMILGVTTGCFWLAYLAAVARRFRSDSLAGQCIVLVVLAAMFCAAQFVLSFVSGGDVHPLVSLGMTWVGIALYGWYAIAIIRVHGLIVRSLESRQNAPASV